MIVNLKHQLKTFKKIKALAKSPCTSSNHGSGFNQAQSSSRTGIQRLGKKLCMAVSQLYSASKVPKSIAKALFSFAGWFWLFLIPYAVPSYRKKKFSQLQYQLQMSKHTHSTTAIVMGLRKSKLVYSFNHCSCSSLFLETDSAPNFVESLDAIVSISSFHSSLAAFSPLMSSTWDWFSGTRVTDYHKC